MNAQEAADAIERGDLVTRHMIMDGLVDKTKLEADPFWEFDFSIAAWFRRTPEFFAARGMAEERLREALPFAETALLTELLEIGPVLPSQEDGPPDVCAPNGIMYRVIMSVDQGNHATHEAPADAIAEWRRRLLEFNDERGGVGTLWWRERPEITAMIPFGETRGRWVVFSRCMIGTQREVAEKYASEFGLS